jgi:cytochrome P450
MLSNPVAMRAAQAEIDAVVRPGFLPTFEDEENLPYVSAIVKETLRWHPVTLIGWCQPHTWLSFKYNSSCSAFFD